MSPPVPPAEAEDPILTWRKRVGKVLDLLPGAKPAARAVAEKLFEWMVRMRLPPLAMPSAAPIGDADAAPEAVRAYNEAAERYFAEHRNREFVLGKPWSDPGNLPRYLFNLGILTHRLQLAPGDTVLELGCGSAWVSHFLNLLGCHTVAIDVAPSAVELGRQLFERSRHTRWELEPAFLAYDGETLPLADESCDAIVLHDAFHHIPNPKRVLAELARVLRTGGMVAMSEPGRDHAGSALSRRETDETGVLENNVLVEELGRLALSVGFTRVAAVPLSLDGTPEVPAEGYVAFLRGEKLLDFWARLIPGLAGEAHVLLYKGDRIPTTRRPKELEARLELVGGPSATTLRPGDRLPLRVRLENRGDTLWLARPPAAGHRGWTRLGAHLYGGGSRRPLDFDWLRRDLPADLAPGDAVELALALPALDRPGDYRVVLDLVAEEVTWFEVVGSPVLELTLRVEE